MLLCKSVYQINGFANLWKTASAVNQFIMPSTEWTAEINAKLRNTYFGSPVQTKCSDDTAVRFRGRLFLSHRKRCAVPLGLGQKPTAPKKTLTPPLQIYDGQTLRCVTSVWSVYKGQWADQRGQKRMNAFGVHTRVQRRASCVSVVISAFFSVCVKVKTEADYRAFWRAMGSVCVCAHTEASLWTQAVVAFLALGAGSWSQISRNLGNVQGGISLALNRRMRDGRVMRGGQGKERKNLFCLSFVAPCRVW